MSTARPPQSASPTAATSPPDVKSVKLVARDAACPAPLAPTASPVSMESPVAPVFLVPPASPAAHHEFARSQPSHHARHAHLASPDHPAAPENQEPLAAQESPDATATMDHPDLRDPPAHLAPMASPEPMDHEASPADQPSPPHQPPESLAAQERLDHLVCLVMLVPPDATVETATLVNVAHPDPLAQVERTASPELLATRDPPDQLESAVSAPNTARSMAASSSKTEHDDKLLQQHKSKTLDCNSVSCLSSNWAILVAHSGTKRDMLAMFFVLPLVGDDRRSPISLSMFYCVRVLLFSWLACVLLLQSSQTLDAVSYHSGPLRPFSPLS